MRLAEGIADVADVDAFVAELDAIGDEFDCAVTALDARYVAGRDHLEAAVERANRAFERDDAIATDRGIEVLLYAAGRRQIERALSMGVRAGRGPVVVVADAGDGSTDREEAAVEAAAATVEPADVLGSARDETLICDFYDITAAERGATGAPLSWLVVERVSLLAIEK